MSNDWQLREAFMEEWVEDVLQMVDSEAVAVDTGGAEVLRVYGAHTHAHKRWWVAYLRILRKSGSVYLAPNSLFLLHNP